MQPLGIPALEGVQPLTAEAPLARRSAEGPCLGEGGGDEEGLLGGTSKKVMRWGRGRDAGPARGRCEGGGTLSSGGSRPRLEGSLDPPWEKGSCGWLQGGPHPCALPLPQVRGAVDPARDAQHGD